jgi:hypothetical protein
MARRGDSSSIILLLVCLIVLVGGVAAGYIAIDKKIIENPFASLLQGEPITPPSSEPLSVPATSTEETDFFMKTDRPKPGAAPFFLETERLNLVAGTTINCKRKQFPGDTNSTLYKYVGGTEVKRYPTMDVAGSWGVSSTSSTPINCRGLTKGADMKGNWSDGQTIKCGDTHYSGDTADTLYQYVSNDTLRKYPDTDTDIAESWGATSATAKSDNCGSYTKGADITGRGQPTDEAYVKIYRDCTANSPSAATVIKNNVDVGTTGTITVCSETAPVYSPQSSVPVGLIEIKNMRLTGSYKARAHHYWGNYSHAQISIEGTKTSSLCRSFPSAGVTLPGKCGTFTWEVMPPS